MVVSLKQRYEFSIPFYLQGENQLTNKTQLTMTKKPNLKPAPGTYLVKQEKGKYDDTTIGGIILPDNYSTYAASVRMAIPAEIVATPIPIEGRIDVYNEGDLVYCDWSKAQGIRIEDEDYVIVPDYSIIGRVVDKEAYGVHIKETLTKKHEAVMRAKLAAERAKNTTVASKPRPTEDSKTEEMFKAVIGEA
jgi:co-chaperonin GroES (HSP10)